VNSRPARSLLPCLARPHQGFEASGERQSWIEPGQLPVTLIIDFDEVLTAAGRSLPRAWVAGPTAKPELVELGTRHTTLDVKLTPLGSARLFGIPTREIADRVVGLEDLVGAAGERLFGQLAETRDWNHRFRLLDEFLLTRPKGRHQPSPVVEEAWRRLELAGGNLRLQELAAALQVSRRHLSSLFHEQVGLPPKTAARLLRFTRARTRLQSGPESCAGVAAECGYFDQPHLNRDFREFAGTNPTRFLAQQV
jgi:AraC-like DNA-binding protein